MEIQKILESGFGTNKTNPFLSISIHFRLLGDYNDYTKFTRLIAQIFYVAWKKIKQFYIYRSFDISLYFYYRCLFIVTIIYTIAKFENDILWKLYFEKYT